MGKRAAFLSQHNDVQLGYQVKRSLSRGKKLHLSSFHMRAFEVLLGFVFVMNKENVEIRTCRSQESRWARILKMMWRQPRSARRATRSTILLTPLHYGIRAMGAMTLRNLELCPSFSPHPNISDGNFNLDHHFFRTQIFQIHEKGAS